MLIISILASIPQCRGIITHASVKNDVFRQHTIHMRPKFSEHESQRIEDGTDPMFYTEVERGRARFRGSAEGYGMAGYVGAGVRVVGETNKKGRQWVLECEKRQGKSDRDIRLTRHDMPFGYDEV